MNYFSEIEEGQAIILNRGVYRQVKLFRRSGKIYARYGAGYARLHQHGSTSHPTIMWKEIDPGHGSYVEHQGSVFYEPEAAAMAAE